MKATILLALVGCFALAGCSFSSESAEGDDDQVEATDDDVASGDDASPDDDDDDGTPIGDDDGIPADDDDDVAPDDDQTDPCADVQCPAIGLQCPPGTVEGIPEGECCPACIPDEETEDPCKHVGCPDVEPKCGPGERIGIPEGECCPQCIPDGTGAQCIFDEDCLLASKNMGNCDCEIECPHAVSRTEYENDECYASPEHPNRDIPDHCFPDIMCDQECPPCRDAIDAICNLDQCITLYADLLPDDDDDIDCALVDCPAVEPQCGPGEKVDIPEGECCPACVPDENRCDFAAPCELIDCAPDYDLLEIKPGCCSCVADESTCSQTNNCAVVGQCMPGYVNYEYAPNCCTCVAEGYAECDYGSSCEWIACDEGYYVYELNGRPGCCSCEPDPDYCAEERAENAKRIEELLSDEKYTQCSTDEDCVIGNLTNACEGDCGTPLNKDHAAQAELNAKLIGADLCPHCPDLGWGCPGVILEPKCVASRCETSP